MSDIDGEPGERWRGCAGVGDGGAKAGVPSYSWYGTRYVFRPFDVKSVDITEFHCK
jgi:hypothetical protein